MQVALVTEIEALEQLSPQWRKIVKGHPFLGPDWLLSWWRHLGSVNSEGSAPRRLAALSVTDDQGQLVALAPWYSENSRLHGRTLKFLGSGSVCSDYLSVACRGGDEAAALESISDWLIEHQGRNDESGWELIALEAVDLTDPCIEGLRTRLDDLGAITSARPAGNCWRIALPETWEAYVAQLSKTNRKRVRRLDRNYLESGRATLHRVLDTADLDYAYGLLVDLHTKRWQARGEEGIFVEPGIDGFHRDVTSRLLATGHLRLSWLEIDGQPAAAEYCVTDGSVVFSYQSGFDPALISHEPGVMTVVATVKDIIECGYTALDFLRGDEPYKLDWRPQQRPIHDVRILPGNLPGQLRQSLWQAATSAKDWLRAGRDAVLSTS